MTFFGDADLDAMLGTDFGVPVVMGSITVKGIVDQFHDEVGGSDQGPQLVTRRVTVRVKTGDLPALAAGASITVDGTAMKVLQALEENDGAITRIDCAKVA